MPSSAVLKIAGTVHRAMLKLSGGRFGWTVANMPVVELTTTGRKSGQPRSTLLTTPWRDGEAMAVIASAGGNEQHPDWYFNLRENPAVTVRMEDGDPRPMQARVTEGEERAGLWDQITSEFSNYADYQTKTDRQIPVVLLEPAD